MTMWNGKLMKENELSKPAKIIVGAGIAILLALSATTAFQNAAHGVVGRPWALSIVLIGFLCFFFPKLSIIRGKKLVSFGTGFMTEHQANFYRAGYFLMVVGLLLSLT